MIVDFTISETRWINIMPQDVVYMINFNYSNSVLTDTNRLVKNPKPEYYNYGLLIGKHNNKFSFYIFELFFNLLTTHKGKRRNIMGEISYKYHKITVRTIQT